MPVTHSGNDWLHTRATVFDALSTLWLVGLREEIDPTLTLPLLF